MDDITWDIYESPIGPLTLIAGDAGLRGLHRRVAHKKAADQFEFAGIGVFSVQCATQAAPYSCGRNSCAARSNTALTNLCPSVAPNCFVSCTASASATR